MGQSVSLPPGGESCGNHVHQEKPYLSPAIPEIPCIVLSQHRVPQDVLGQRQNSDLTLRGDGKS